MIPRRIKSTYLQVAQPLRDFVRPILEGEVDWRILQAFSQMSLVCPHCLFLLRMVSGNSSLVERDIRGYF